MEDLKKEELFISVVARVNRYFIIMGVFFLVYFVLQTKVNVFLFLLALSFMAFALLSHKHLDITNRLYIELQRAKNALKDVSEETRRMHE